MEDLSKVYILIPLYNEATVIEDLVKQLSLEFDNIVIINDGSTDNSQEILERLDIHLINHPINMGQGSAISTGFNYIYKTDAKALITFDADGEHKTKDMIRTLKLNEKLSTHSTRRYFITEMLKKTGGNIPLVAQLAGHSTWDVVRLYTKDVVDESADVNVGLF